MTLADLKGKFFVISLETQDSFIFDLFPTRDQGIQETDHVNWEAQDASIGVKPLFYANTDPRKISVPEVIIDGSRNGRSINEQIDKLRALKNEMPGKGAPPALLIGYGDRRQRCVLEEVVVSQTVFTRAGDPSRARCSLQFLELQEQGTAVDVQINDEVGPPL